MCQKLPCTESNAAALNPVIFSRCTLLFQTDVTERSTKQTMPFRSYLPATQWQTANCKHVNYDVECFYKKMLVFHNCCHNFCFQICIFKGPITKSILVSLSVFFLQTLTYWNTSLDILAQHHHIMTLILMFMVMNIFWRGTLIHIWFINVMNARNDQIICSCALDMQWGVLDWLKFKIGMPKLY